jgi:hypothetical protein
MLNQKLIYPNASACINAGDSMKRFTVSIPKSLKDKLDQMPEINWSQVAKLGMLKRLEKLEHFDEIENKGLL